MRIIPFPTRDGAPADEAWLLELEAALSGTGDQPQAVAWRQLRDDVRSLAPPPAPEFERALGDRIAEPRKRSRGRSPAARLAALFADHRPTALALATTLGILLAVSLIVQPWGVSERRAGTVAIESAPSVRVPGGGATAHSFKGNAQANGAQAGGAVASSASPPAVAGSQASSPSGAPSRVQQLAASIGLLVAPGEVQSVADAVARLAASVGGFVRSSHVQVEQAGSSGAELALSLPSAKLDAALASLGRLAPVGSESQSLQDITDSYEAARRRLSDAQATRQALLRALSAALTAGQIDSLRERLAAAGREIAQASAALQAVSRRASSAEVEVTVTGDRHAASEGLTLHHALHDAGRVLLATLTVLLIGAAVLVPLALLVAALLLAAGAVRRYRRERVLDTL